VIGNSVAINRPTTGRAPMPGRLISASFLVGMEVAVDDLIAGPPSAPSTVATMIPAYAADDGESRNADGTRCNEEIKDLLLVTENFGGETACIKAPRDGQTKQGQNNERHR
jgi:hypothetical protein